jgi:surface polysaccharide O-acyltransferase-like enzyme
MKFENNGNDELPTNERFHFLDAMRGVAIFMVVCVHAQGYCLPLAENCRVLFSFLFHTITVPVFFMADGFLFANKTTKGKSRYSEVIIKSIKRLVIPWLIFSFLYLFMRAVLEFTGFFKETIVIGKSPSEIALNIYGSVYALHLYFLISLFYIRLLLPVFTRIAKLKNTSWVIAIFAIYLISHTACSKYISDALKIPGGLEPLTHALWGIQYYIAGIILYRLRSVTHYCKWYIPAVFVIVTVIHYHLAPMHLFEILIQYLYLFTLYIVFSEIRFKMVFLNLVGKNTMGIFLLHSPILLSVISQLFNRFIEISLINYFTICVVTFFATYSLVLLVKRIPLGSYLFGESNKITN